MDSPISSRWWLNIFKRLLRTDTKLLQEKRDEGYCKTIVLRFESKESVVFFNEIGKYPKKLMLV